MKKIDAVKMKNSIQRALQAEREGKSDEQIRMERQKHLMGSDDPVARFWRRSRGKAPNTAKADSE